MSLFEKVMLVATALAWLAWMIAIIKGLRADLKHRQPKD